MEDPIRVLLVSNAPDATELIDHITQEARLGAVSAAKTVPEAIALIKQKPFEVIKTNPIAARKLVSYLAKELSRLAETLQIFMPDTAQKIQQAIKENKKPENLFPRKE